MNIVVYSLRFEGVLQFQMLHKISDLIIFEVKLQASDSYSYLKDLQGLLLVTIRHA